MQRRRGKIVATISKAIEQVRSSNLIWQCDQAAERFLVTTRCVKVFIGLKKLFLTFDEIKGGILKSHILGYRMSYAFKSCTELHFTNFFLTS